jgi:hypothetical protein
MSFTQTDCRKIAKKLYAKIATKRSAHDMVEITYEGILIAQFGIRRASKEVGHGRLPNDLHLSQKQCKELAQCPMTKDKYFSILKEKGHLPP